MEPAEAARLRARIAADPDDVALRLAYADVIEAIDPDRATFIRLQCRADRDRPGGAVDEAQVRGENALLVRGGAGWASHLPPAATGWRFARGFIELVSLDADAFLREAGRIAAADPVRHWDLCAASGRLAEIAAHQALGRARSLSLAGNDLDDGDVAAFARAPAMPELVWLDISHNPRIGLPSLRVLASAPALAALEVVELGGIGCAPLHRPAYDWDGTLVTVDRNPIGDALEKELGRRIRWLYPLADRAAEPADRFRLRPAR